MGGGKFRRIALFPLMLLTLLLLPTRMVAQTDYVKSVTFTALAANPEGYLIPNYACLFDGKKEPGNFSKWYEYFDSKGTYVIFKASKAGVPVGYTITTGNDNANSGCGGRNPLSWKLYGNNTGKDGTWTLIDQVSNDTKLKDVNFASYDFTCKGSTSYKYFKWEITAIHSGSIIQVGEFELKLKTSNQAYAEFNNGTLTFKYGPKPAGAYDLNVGKNHPEWVDEELYTKINKVVFDASFANARPTSCYYWFAGCTELTSIEGIEYLNTENVTDMSNMFNCCTALTSLDVTNFNTAKVTDMSRMFFCCQRLNTLDVSNFNTAKVTDMSKMFYGCQMFNTLDVSKFNTENVTDMNYMFYACKKLSSLNLSNFNTEKVTRMFFMFAYCSALPSLKVSNFNTAKVTDMQDMFSHCSTLTTLDLSNFNTENVTDMGAMFYGCSALTSLDLSNFNTAKVTNMNFMFFECKSLTSLDLSNFNTAEVTEMYRMFEECNQLTTLDLTSFNTAKVTDMERMFESCYDLKTIYVSDNFVTTKVGSSNNMFYYCVNLKGAIDKYYGSKVNHTYANYKTGYFTKLVGKNGDEKIGATGETLATDNLVLEDGKDFVAYEPFTATAASYNRTMKEGTTWATLCLPFEVSLDNQNFRAFKLLSADEGTETVELEEIETSIAAGTPVIIKMKDGETQLDFSVENKAIAKDVQTSKADNGNYQLQGLYTQKMFSKDADNNCYIVKGNKLMNPAKLLENTKVQRVASKPFRAYMVDNSPAPAAGAKMFSIGFDDDSATAIDSLNTIANDKAKYYDLQGKRLNEPQKGINIVKRGGKTMKVIIK